ncbi:hypothetical protein [Hafnia paralvei]|uniref:hypothetical protein n=1 Tax=Hafnia paralvei TaxID=546367 RepID=UPI0014194F38|nr:hypothetical protein [Hafnia paralvei]NIH33124.1 hypothetical protein [Hafnia paralvei]
MRQERTLRIRAFRRALELAAGERAKDCRHFHRWKMELRNFPHGSCDLASNTLAQYLIDTEGGHPCIISMEGNAGFQKAEKSTVHGHVIVLLDGEYIDLTLDQFEEYPNHIPSEPVESGGPLGKLLRNIMKHEDHVQTRQVNLNGGEELYVWLRDTANEVLAADPEWQALEREKAAFSASTKAIFTYDIRT